MNENRENKELKDIKESELDGEIEIFVEDVPETVPLFEGINFGMLEKVQIPEGGPKVRNKGGRPRKPDHLKKPRIDRHNRHLNPHRDPRKNDEPLTPFCKYPRGMESKPVIRPYDKSRAFKKQQIPKAISRISGYPEYMIKDVLHYLAAITEIKLAQNIPVWIEGLGLFDRKAAREQMKYNQISGKNELMYQSASCKFTPDRYMRDALNCTPDRYRIDFTRIPEEKVFEIFRLYYDEKYGKDFELMGEQFGTMEDVLDGLKFFEGLEDKPKDASKEILDESQKSSGKSKNPRRVVQKA